MFRNNYIINELIQLSEKSNCNYKHASAIIKNEKVLSFGYNYHYNNISIHAEIDACKNFMKISKIKNLQGLDIIVIRSGNDKNIKLSKPCLFCFKFLQEKNIRKIYYSDENGTIINSYTCDFKTNHICSSTKFKN